MPTPKSPASQGGVLADAIADLMNRIKAPAFIEGVALASSAIGHARVAGNQIDPAMAAEIAKHLRFAADTYEQRATHTRPTTH